MANGGGRVDAGALRSIEVLDALAAEKGGVSNVVVAHHTGKLNAIVISKRCKEKSSDDAYLLRRLWLDEHQRR